jgi:inositol-phosphate phosphatase / L-galactose 1-phosphate phosphatase / histidinol-phosphatase
VKELLAFAHRLADASAPIIAQYFRSPAASLSYKDDASPVTQADREVERVLRAMITKAYPHHGIVGEEYGNHQPDADYQWILDPIDGTKAFSCGRLDFGTLIGLMHHDEMVLGLLNQPITKERWIGYEGDAFLNAARLATNAEARINTARFATTSHVLFNALQQQKMLRVAGQCALAQYGGDCYNYGLLAAGHIDVIMEAGLNTFDILPLLPILQNAGAVVTDWRGDVLNPKNTKIDIIVTANELLHNKVLHLIGGA